MKTIVRFIGAIALILVVSNLWFATCTSGGAHGERGIVVEKLPHIETDIVAFPQIGHTGEILSVAFSPDGRHIISGSSDQTIKLWDADSGREIRTFSSHSESVNSVAFSFDGKYIISGSSDKMMKLWDTTTGCEMKTLPDYTKVFSVAFSPNGKLALSSSSAGDVKLWDVEKYLEIRTFSRHKGSVYTVSFSPEGKQFLSGSRDKTVKLWDVETGREIRTFSGHTDEIYSVAFSPDGKQILSGSRDQTMKLWDAATGREIKTFSGHTGEIYSVAFSPDGKHILSGSRDQTMKLWDVDTGREIRTFTGYVGSTSNIKFSPDGKQILSRSHDEAKLWDTDTGRVIRIFTGLTNNDVPVVFSPDGKQILSYLRDEAKLWDTATGSGIRTFTGLTNIGVPVAFSPDGKQILSYLRDTIMLWDTDTGKVIRTFTGHSNDIISAAFSPDGKQIISGSGSMIPRLFDIKELILWDVATGREIRTFAGHTGSGISVAFSPDGKQILSGSRYFVTNYRRIDKTIKLWYAVTGREIRTFTGHTGSINSVAFSPDGKQILSNSTDGTIRLWEVSSGKEIAQFISFSGSDTQLASTTRGLDVETQTAAADIEGEWLSITPDGFYTASTRGDRYLNVRVGNTVTSIDSYSDIFYKPEVVQARLRGLPDPASKANVTIQQANTFLPPTVTIQSPSSGTTNSAVANLSVIVTDRNQPVRDIRILVNGVRIGSEELNAVKGTDGIVVEEGGLSVKRDRKTVQFTVPVSLVESGNNRIEVMAYNGYSWGYSGDTGNVDLNWQPPAGMGVPLPDLWILAIGVNTYDNALTGKLATADGRSLDSLNYCGNDAKEVVRSLEAQKGKRYREVHSRLLTDDAIIPTAANIRENIRFLEQAGQRDVVLLFIAGHGISVDGRFYFLTRNAVMEQGRVNPDYAISDDALKAVLNAPGRRLVFIDACQSGGMDIDGFMHSLKRTNACMLSSSEGNRPSYEDDPKIPVWDRHGVFTYSVIRGLNGMARPRSGASISVLQLSGYVRNTVMDLTISKQYQQRPVQYSWGFSDFDIAR